VPNMTRSLTRTRRRSCPHGTFKVRGLEGPKTLRWRATFRSCAPLATRSAICVATALDVNGDHDTSPVAGHAAAEISPPIRTASTMPVPLHELGGHVVVSLARISGATSACRIDHRIALLELEMPSDPTHGSDDVPELCCGRVNE